MPAIEAGRWTRSGQARAQRVRSSEHRQVDN
jgi:hypothetical protein